VEPAGRWPGSGSVGAPTDDRRVLQELARTSALVAASSSRLAKVAVLADCLRRLSPAEVVPAVAYLSGELPQRQIGVGWAALRELPGPAAEPTLTVGEVDALLGRVGAAVGPGSQAERRRLLGALFGRATEVEQWFLRGLLSGELRQGALEGVMLDAVARAAGVPGPQVRRALLLRGDVRRSRRRRWPAAPRGCRPSGCGVGQPLRPMLA
jgi:ATP-dependent DNA ligase